MKRYIKRICSVVLFLSLFLGSFCGWNYLLCDDATRYTRLMMHELYHPDANIDIAFVGSSHLYRSLVPSVTDEIFGCNTFNAGSSAQQMDGSYALIREICKDNDVKQIYLELYYGVCGSAPYNTRKELTSTYILSDYMKPSLNKLNYLLHASSKAHWTNSFLPFRRNWEKLFDWKYLRRTVQTKSTEAYKNYEWIPNNSGEYYDEKGFVGNKKSIKVDPLSVNSPAYGSIHVPDISAQTDWRKSLLSIVQFCEKRQIELIFFMAPIPEYTIVGKGNYQQYHDYIQTIADENHIPFYDFNLVKDACFDANNLQLFYDAGHLNTAGAEAFSTLFSDFFTGRIAHSDLFYDSYSDKLLERGPLVYGVAVPEKRSETSDTPCYVIANGSGDIQCRITAQTSAGETRQIQDFSDNLHFSLPAEETGVLTIEWFSSDRPDQVRTLLVGY